MIGPMPICYKCKHFIEGKGFKCRAFPEGIPERILVFGDDHKKPTKNQKNKIVFEKK